MSLKHADKRATRVAQAAVIFAVAGTVALAVGPVSDFLAPRVPKPKSNRAAIQTTPGNDGHVMNAGFDAAADALSLANPRTERPEAVEPEPQGAVGGPDPVLTADSDVPEPAPGPTGEWHYIGSIVSAKNAYAWFTVDGFQFLLARGKTRDGRTLEEVYADHVIVVADDGLRERIELLPPNLAWPEPGMQAAAGTGINVTGVASRGPGQSGNLQARAPRSSDVYREQIRRSKAASTPPVRPGPGGTGVAAANGNARTPVELDETGFPRNLDPVEFSDFITKVSLSDYDPAWAKEVMQRAGIEIDLPINEQIDRLADLGVTIESNPTFFERLPELNERIIETEEDPATRDKLQAILDEQRMAEQQANEPTEEMDEETRRKLEEIRQKHQNQ